MNKVNNEKEMYESAIDTSKDIKMSSSWIEFSDTASTIKIGYGVKFNNCQISVKSGSTLIINDLCELTGRIIVEDNSSVNIGNGLVCNDAILMHAYENTNITIKDDCLFANPKIYTSDMHAIYDLSSGERINKAKDVVIGNTVWIARDVIILKNTFIDDGCVIGAGSVVVGKKDRNSIIAGNPAKIIKTGIRWSRIPYENASTIIPASFKEAKFRSYALQMNHQMVIDMAISFWNKKEDMSEVDYHIYYYLCRSLLKSKFIPQKTNSIHINGNEIFIDEIAKTLYKCYFLSKSKNGPSGGYAYLAANLSGDIKFANEIYNNVKLTFPHIDKSEFNSNN
jgi:acetyltransferase-like isoleucine patch superfamily enzyme